MRHREAWSAFSLAVAALSVALAAFASIPLGLRVALGVIALGCVVVAAMLLAHWWPFNGPDPSEFPLASSSVRRRVGIANYGGRSRTRGSQFGSDLDAGIENWGGEVDDEGSTFGRTSDDVQPDSLDDPEPNDDPSSSTEP